MKVRCQRAENVGLIAFHSFFGHKKIDHLARCESRGFIKIRMQSHGNVMRRRFGARPSEPLSLADRHLHGSTQRGLQCGNRHFAVTLHGMPIAHREQGPAHVNRKIQRGSGDQFLIVQITGVVTRRAARYASNQRIRSHSDGTEEGSNFQTNPRRKLRCAGPCIEPNKFSSGVWKLVREGSTGGNKAADAVRMKEFETKNLHFQGVAGFRALNPNRPRQGMSAGTALFDTLLDGFQRARYLCFRNTRCSEPLHSARDHGLHADRIAGGHP